MEQSDASDDRTAIFGYRLRRLAEIEMQVRLHHERSQTLIADAKRIVAAVREAREHRPNRSVAAFDALLAAKEMAERASEAKSELLARVAHDLKQPIQVILGAAEMLEPHVPEERKRLLDRIDRAAQRLNRALDVLLDAAQADSTAMMPRIAPVPVDPLIAAIERELRPAAEAKALTLRMRPCGDGVRVLSDAEHLSSIVRNLVENAIKYTDSGAVLVRCRRRRREDAAAADAAAAAVPAVEIQVRDTGRGIGGVDIGSIFEPFHRLEPDAGHNGSGGGYGLGLAIVKRLADTLGHELTVRSAPGRGSCFGIVVPVAEEQRHEQR